MRVGCRGRVPRSARGARRSWAPPDADAVGVDLGAARHRSHVGEPHHLVTRHVSLPMGSHTRDDGVSLPGATIRVSAPSVHSTALVDHSTLTRAVRSRCEIAADV